MHKIKAIKARYYGPKPLLNISCYGFPGLFV